MDDSNTSATSSIHTTLLASIRSVGTAVTLAAVGFYLHQRGCIIGAGKKTLALLCQQVQFPLFLFTKILYCNQNWSPKPCPDVRTSLAYQGTGLVLLLWPLFVVGAGLVVGAWVAKLTNTPRQHVRSVWASCAFPNNTALPITLLTVISSNFPAGSNLGNIDPTLFLSVYLLVYPVLQWGIGGWLLAPEEEEEEVQVTSNDNDDNKNTKASEHLGLGLDDDDEDESLHDEPMTTPFKKEENETYATSSSETSPLILCSPLHRKSGRDHYLQQVIGGDHHKHHHSSSPNKMISPSKKLTNNVLNNQARSQFFLKHRLGMASSDEGLYTSELDLNQIWKNAVERQHQQQQLHNDLTSPNHNNSDFGMMTNNNNTQNNLSLMPQVPEMTLFADDMNNEESILIKTSQRLSCRLSLHKQISGEIAASIGTGVDLMNMDDSTNQKSAWETCQNILERCLQPPVVGALLGIVCACHPSLRAVFVDLDRHANAPMQWMFDGLYQVGQTAVPTNMMILGCNLSAGAWFQPKPKKDSVEEDNVDDILEKKGEDFPLRTMIGMVIGKQIILPIIGILSTIVLKEWVLDLPQDIAGAFYLVIIIVFLTPSANNVMVMVELSGNSTDAFATVIAIQYALAPILLSLTLTIAIGVASDWS